MSARHVSVRCGVEVEHLAAFPTIHEDGHVTRSAAFIGRCRRCGAHSTEDTGGLLFTHAVDVARWSAARRGLDLSTRVDRVCVAAMGVAA